MNENDITKLFIRISVVAIIFLFVVSSILIEWFDKPTAVLLNVGIVMLYVALLK